MSITVTAISDIATRSRPMAGPMFVAICAVALAAGFLVAGDAAASHADPDLTRLMRGMAAIKGSMAAAATAAVVWRFGLPATPLRFTAYALAAAAMWAGPGLIWGMAHIGAGALLLHGGLAATIILLWRDPATAGRLASVAALRRVRR